MAQRAAILKQKLCESEVSEGTADEHPRKRARLQALELMQLDDRGYHVHAEGAANGHHAVLGQLGPRGLIHRDEYVRLIQQALTRLGYDNVALALQRASGIQLQAEEVDHLVKAVLEGNWDTAANLLDLLPFNKPEDCRQAKFLVLEQKYLEALQRQDLGSALECLRNELAGLGVEQARLQHLASCCIFCGDAKQMKLRAGWQGDSLEGRHIVLEALKLLIPRHVLLPDGRLEELLEQALLVQLSRNPFHNSPLSILSLMSDYTCGREQIPCRTVQVLTDHADEVWHLRFSHSGRGLASASKDGVARIWDVQLGLPGGGGAGGSGRERVRFRAVLQGHTRLVSCLAWSPDDTLLATGGHDGMLKLWDAGSGACVRTFTAHAAQAQLLCCAWLPDGRQVVTGGDDRQVVVQEAGSGAVLRRWRDGRVSDMAVTPDGQRLICSYGTKEVHIFKLSVAGHWDDESAAPLVITEAASVISLQLASDGINLLLHLENRVIHRWQLPADWGPGQEALPAQPECAYRGPPEQHLRFMVRSCFGGFEERFVLSGSEESKVYVWLRETGELLHELEGHSGTVNAVSWNPQDYHMFASASDDKSIHIWGLAEEGPAHHSLPALQPMAAANGHSAAL